MRNILGSIIECHAEQKRDELAYTYICDNGEIQEITFGELHKHVTHYACAIRKLTAERERAVLLLPQGLDYITTFLSCLLSNVISVPLYPPRKNQHSNRVDNVVVDCQPSLIITTQELVTDLRAVYPDIDVVAVESLKHSEASSFESNFELNTTAFLQYTSGSTGAPKGVMVSHQNIIANLDSLIEASECSEKDVFCNWLPLFHDLGLINTLLLPVYMGAHSVIMSPMNFMRRPIKWFKAISDYKGTICGAPNFAFDYCIEKLTAKHLEGIDLSHWKVAFNAAEPIKQATLDNFSEKFSPYGFKEKAFFPSYGMAEATVFISSSSPHEPYNCVSFDAESLENGFAKPVEEGKGVPLLSCGHAQSKHELTILDCQTDALLPEGAVGQICFSGPSVALGYWGDENKTTECFNVPISGKESLFLKTGDLGFLCNGELFITGRMKDLMIVNGRNLYPQDFETLIFDAFDYIRPNGVVAFEQAGQCYMAIECDKSRLDKVDFEEAVEDISKLVFSYFEVNLTDIVFVQPGTLSKTSSGKVQRSAMKKQYFTSGLKVVDSLKDIAHRMITHDGKFENEMEAKLADIWKGVLQVDTVPPQQSFFALGGNSVTALKLLSELDEQLDINADISELMHYDTIRKLATYLINNQVACSELDGEQEVAHLTSIQNSMLFAEQRSRDGLYNLGSAFLFDGAIDQSVLNHAFNKLIERHSILRTVLQKQDDGTHLQKVRDKFQFQLEVINQAHDLEDMQPLIDQYTLKPFDLYNDLMFRAKLVKINEGRSLLVIVTHHLFADGWSQNVLLSDLGKIYDAMVHSSPLKLPKIKQEYDDFAKQLAAHIQTADFSQQLQFWKSKLEGAPELHKLPTDQARSNNQDFICGSVEQKLDVDLVEKLKQFAAKNSTTLHSVLSSALAIMMHQLSGEQDVLFGYPVANRPNNSYSNTVGCFVNTVVSRHTILAEQSLLNVVENAKKELLESIKYSHVPFDFIVNECVVAQARNFNPLVQVMLVQDQGLTALNLNESYAQQCAVKEVSEFDLTLRYQPSTSDCPIVWQFNEQLFYSDTITRFSKYFARILQAFTNDPEQKVADLPLTIVDDQRLLTQWNDTECVFSDMTCVHEFIEEKAKTNSSAIGVKFKNETLSYEQLNQSANQLAHTLRSSYGVKTGDIVGLYFERSIEMVIGILAVLKAGAAYLPIDPELPQERVKFIVNDSGLSCILTEGKEVSAVIHENVNSVDLKSESVHTLIEQAPINNILLSDIALNPQGLAYVIYTSGSTGNPKGVMIPHDALTNRIEWMQNAFSLSSEDNILQKTPYSFDVSVWEFIWPLCYGATLVVAEPEMHKDPLYLNTMIQNEAISIIHFVPSMLNNMLAVNAWQEFSSLRYVICSGEALSSSVVSEFYTCSSHTTLVNLYGPTEATIDVTYHICDAEKNYQCIPIGKPIQNTKLYVLDENLKQLPVGAIGELYLSGIGVAKGYMNREDLNTTHFIKNPFYGPGEAKYYQRLYKTGDLVRWLNTGELEYLGRNDCQVKIRGFRVELGEIEEVISRHPDIDQVVVKVIEKNDVSHLTAFYTTNHGRVTEQELAALLAQFLPSYMIPTYFVAEKSMPLSSNGKIAKKQLNLPVNTDSEKQYVAPTSKEEEALCDIFKVMFSMEKVSVTDNFFSLGGNSLQVSKLIAEISKQGFGLELKEVYRASSIRDLATSLKLKNNESDTKLELRGFVPPLNQSVLEELCYALELDINSVEDAAYLSSLQEGFLYHHQLSEDFDPYITHVELAFSNDKGLDTFINAIKLLIDRHKALRTSIHWENLAQPVQVVHKEAVLSIEQIELSGDYQQDYFAEVYDSIKAKIDITTAPCWQFHIGKKQGEERRFLVMQMHHIVDDAASFKVLFDDLIAILKHEELQTSSVGFVNEKASENSEVTTDIIDVFKPMLAPFVEGTYPYSLKQDKHNQNSQSKSLELTSDISEQIRRLSRDYGTSPATLFHLLWGTIVAQLSGRDEALFGTVMSGRTTHSSDLSGAVGAFINTLPLGLSFKGKKAHEIVEEIKVSLGSLLKVEHTKLNDVQNLSNLTHGTPLFTTLLNYRHPIDIKQVKDELNDVCSVDHIAYREVSNFPLTLDIDDLGCGKAFTLHITTAEPDKLAKITEQLEHSLMVIMDVLGAAPNTLWSDLNLLTDSDSQLLNGMLSHSDVEAKYASLHQLFENQACQNPNKNAVFFEGKYLSFSELNKKANQLAHYLNDTFSLNKNSRIAICLDRSLEMVVSILAVLKTGSAFVPIDPSTPIERMDYILDDVNPAAVLSKSAIGSSHRFEQAEVILLDSLLATTGDSNLFNKMSIDNLMIGENYASPDRLAYIIYTSGSSGKPKGVMISQANLAALTGEMLDWFVPMPERFGWCANYVFDASIQGIVYLAHGCTLDVIGHDLKLQPEKLSAHLQTYQVDVLDCTPSLLEFWLGEVEEFCLPNLLIGGEAIHQKLWDRLAHSSEVNDKTFYNVYGPTECTVNSTRALICGDSPTIGTPLSYTDSAVLVPNSNMITPVNVIGELCISGVGVGAGYLNEKELTSSNFVELQVLNKKALYYRTGDLVRLREDGSYDYVSRLDSQVKIRGFRIELGEVQNKILSMDYIDSAFVTSFSHNNTEHLAAYVTFDKNHIAQEFDIKEQLVKYLPDYMIPSVFIPIDYWPMTSNGKIDIKALPEPNLSFSNNINVLARNSLEERLSNIWKQVLKLDEVCVKQSFFDLGGDSIMATRIASLVKSDFEVQIPLNTFMSLTSIEALAIFISSIKPEAVGEDNEAVVEEGFL